MKVEVEQKDREFHRWRLVARFEYGAHAMEAARALSEADGGTYRVIDRRWMDEEPQAIIYKGGVAQ